MTGNLFQGHGAREEKDLSPYVFVLPKCQKMREEVVATDAKHYLILT